MLNHKSAVYRFTVIPGKEATFEAARLKRTQGIYLRLGSLGSRLHRQVNGDYIAYAQWPSREVWLNAEGENLDAQYRHARNEVQRCLLIDKTLYEVDVAEDYLQIRASE